MNKILELFPKSWGERFIALLYALAIGAAIYLPFLEGFALTPVVTFVQRFSITLNLGSDTKTLQVMLFLIPIFLVKALQEYNKRYNIRTLLQAKIIWILGALLAVDVLFTIFSTNRMTSLFGLGVRIVLYSVFITTSIWLKIIFDGLFKQNLLKSTYQIARVFIISLGIFTFLNGFISATQILDCSIINKQCTAWAWIDSNFPNKLLEVGHQTFSDDFNLIRTPGTFGDVNLNGMFALMVAAIFVTLFLIEFIARQKKGHSEKRMIWFFAAVVIVAFATYILTVSRSALLGFFPVMAIVSVVLLYPILKQAKLLRKAAIVTGATALGGAIIIGVLLLIGTQITMPHKEYAIKATVTEQVLGYVGRIIKPSDPSAQDHARLFDKAIEIWQKSNYMGFGLGTFKQSYTKYIDEKSLNADPHSVYATILTEQGILGFAAFAIFVVFIWYSALRFLVKAKSIILENLSGKTLTKEQYIQISVLAFIGVFGFMIPFLTITSATYYGFLLPMSWWWGSTSLIEFAKKKV